MARTWIFQSNPDRFDIDGFLTTNPTGMTFLVTRYRADVAVGDQVFIWRSAGKEKGGTAGIIAEGEVIEPVSIRPDDSPARRFWTNSADAANLAERTVIRFRRVVSDRREIIQRHWLPDDPELRDLTILKMANSTNYEVSSGQAARLNALWLRTGRDWTYAESVAGLMAYQRTHGQQVSRLPGSPVAETALLLGRAVSGVYNKVMNFRSIDPRDPRKGLSGGGANDERAWIDFYDSTSGAIDDGRLTEEFRRLWDVPDAPAPISDAASQNETIEAEVRHLCSLDLAALMDRYRAGPKGGQSKPSAKRTTTRLFARDPLIVAIGKVRAGFKCEVAGCSQPTFFDVGNQPYCEVHHIRPLSEGGADDPENVACLCPTHHREAHHGRAANKLRVTLVELRKLAKRL
jgi:hypothetical protein